MARIGILSKTQRRRVMEKILERIEQAVEKMISDLEKSPIKTSIKVLIFYWIAKRIWREIR